VVVLQPRYAPLPAVYFHEVEGFVWRRRRLRGNVEGLEMKLASSSH
jgi:hypothetical protein